MQGKDADPLLKLQSLGYTGGSVPKKKKVYEIKDDLKSLAPVISHLFMAVEESQAGNTELALKMVNNVIRIRPTYSSAYSNLAFILYNTGQTDQALAALEQGLKRIPGDLMLTSNLGVMLVMAKKFEEAIKPLEYCVKMDRFNPDYLNYLGRALMEIKDYTRAEDYLNRALNLDPRLVPAYSNLGYLNLILYIQTSKQKYYDASIQNFDKALALKPGLPSALKGKESALKYKKF